LHVFVFCFYFNIFAVESPNLQESNVQAVAMLFEGDEYKFRIWKIQRYRTMIIDSRGRSAREIAGNSPAPGMLKYMLADPSLAQSGGDRKHKNS
jgi:hypothetical protein